MDSTFDEIARCPRCEEVGIPAGTKSGPNRSTFYLFKCDNPRCRWYHPNVDQRAPWIRQRNPDGTWVQAQKHQKQFPKIPDRTAEVQESIDRSLAQQMGNPDRGY